MLTAFLVAASAAVFGLVMSFFLWWENCGLYADKRDLQRKLREACKARDAEHRRANFNNAAYTALIPPHLRKNRTPWG